MKIIEKLLAEQMKNVTYIQLTFIKNDDLTKNICLYEKQGIHFLATDKKVKAISASESFEIRKMILQKKDRLGNNVIIVEDEYYYSFWHECIDFRDNDKLEKVSVALFGKSWEKELVDALDVDDITITAWLQCTRPIPHNVWVELGKIAKARKKDIQDAVDMLTISYTELTEIALKRVSGF